MYVFVLIAAISALLVGYDLALHGIKDRGRGTWQFHPTAWIISMVFAAPLVLPVYLWNRRQIIPVGTRLRWPAPNDLLPSLFSVIATGGMMAAVFTQFPTQDCSDPVRLRGLQEALLSQKGVPVEAVVAKRATLESRSLVSQESLCRAIVDIKFAGQPAETDAPIWYKVVPKGAGWGSYVAGHLQAHEAARQFDGTAKS